MNLGQALSYFFREAVVNLIRGWKVSLLAVLTISVSLFVSGAFLIVSQNLSRTVERWRGEARVVVYLEPGAAEEGLRQLQERVLAVPWVTSARQVSAAEARRRFEDLFPSLVDLVEGSDGEPFPPSLEIAFDSSRAEPGGFDRWLEALEQDPAVGTVDDDRDWLSQLETLIAVVRLVGLVLGGVLLGAAIFIIASIIRLTAFLYSDEIAVMRLVGATEFFIRGPFYAEGLIQGLLGGGLALVALYGAHGVVRAQAPTSLLGQVATGAFLSWQAVVFVALVGGLAGLAGAVASLRRESLGHAPESPP